MTERMTDRMTERPSPRHHDLETWPVADLVAAITESQFTAIAAVQAAGPTLGRAVAGAATRLARGGRLIYLGAGTSGRLAMLDAAELPPTFGWPPDRALALIAGGPSALTTAIEGAEDDARAAAAALSDLACGPDDVVIGLAASGATPFTVAGLRAARASGALTIGIANAPGTPLIEAAEIGIALDTGPELVAGSTRMKAGTAQKVALTTFSTALMVRLGLVYQGRMVEMRPTNAKLQRRAEAIVADLTGVCAQDARAALARAEGSIKLATIMLALDLPLEAARARLDAAGGRLADALKP
ncbi:N-acetylmuramic acid 6-phosphate etherase [Rhodobacteraceae bacterium MBR-64]